MTELDRNRIANERFHLISGVVNRANQLDAGEIAAYFREISAKTWTCDYWTERRFSIRTLERWKQNYARHGIDGLKPATPPKRGTIAIAPEVLALAESIRKQSPMLSVESIIYQLVKDHGIEAATIVPSTLARHFRREGMSRQQLVREQAGDYGFRRFEAESPMDLWQSDFHHTLYIPNPLRPGRYVLAKLCGILDDHSRYIVHGQYYLDEKMPSLEDCLKKAIEKHGVPTQFYCDNGACYSAHHIKHICARLGIRLSHSQPGRPQGRGKIERIFRFVDTSFKPYAEQKIRDGELKTLEELNALFNEWLHGHYHSRIHRTTQQKPIDRFSAYPCRELPYTREELRRIFFLEETRKVDKAGCVSLHNTQYEVPAELCGMSVEIRYDAYNIHDAQVYVDGTYSGVATILEPGNNFRKPSKEKQLLEQTSEEYSLHAAMTAHAEVCGGDSV
jgi:putative transposase